MIDTHVLNRDGKGGYSPVELQPEGSQTKSTLPPSDHEAKQLQYGEQLIRVRYRYDEQL